MIYFVATPIGNLSDITYRAIEVLSSADVILCEDTRHSRILLDRYNIHIKLMSYHKFNEMAMVDKVIGLANEGKTLAVISDAGMPAINDPGSILVRALIERNIQYSVIPGACAMINAFVMSGYEAPFCYLGFLPAKTSDRVRLLENVKQCNIAIIVYVSVHDLERDRQSLLEILGDRPLTVVRELTKLHEQTLRTTLGATLPPMKGEFVFVIDKVDNIDKDLTELTPLEHLQYHLDSGMDKNSAVKITARQRGVSKNDIYQLTITK